MEPDEVAAMSAKFQPAPIEQMSPDEVAAMSAKFQPEQAKVGIIVIYDPELEAYRYY
jgi:hypothetical protein